MLLRARMVAVAALFPMTLGGILLTGTPTQAVVGGTPTTLPSVVKLSIGDVRGCSGVLIDPQWVVTARSCFAENGTTEGAPKHSTIATVGRADLSTTGGHEVAVVHVVPRADRNVALVKLARMVLDVPVSRVGSSAPGQGMAVQVAGYGRTGTEWSPDEANAATFEIQNLADTSIELAAPEASTCKGDAGGPAWVNVRDPSQGSWATTPSVIAVNDTSWQHGCLEGAETRQGTTTARIDNLGTWITDRIFDLTWLANGNSGMCLSANGSNKAGAVLVQVKCQKNAADQQWTVTRRRQTSLPKPFPSPPITPYVSISNGHGLCLDVLGGVLKRAAQLIQDTCKSDGYYKWDVAGGQVSEIRTMGKLTTGEEVGCIGIGGGSQAVGAKAILWGCTNNIDQKWIHAWPPLPPRHPRVASEQPAIGKPTSGSAGLADDAQPGTEETNEYPFAGKIFTERGIRLIKGDGNIRLVDCESSANLIAVHTYEADAPFCFQVRGSRGFLTMELADVYGIRSADHAVAATVSVDDKEKTVVVPKNDWRGVGVGAGENEATLLEIRVTP